MALVSLYFTFAKPKKKGGIVKNKIHKVSVCREILQHKLFCSKFSREYKFYKKITEACFEFNKTKLFNYYYDALQKSGIDIDFPVFKLEAYGKNLVDDILNDLLALKNLEEKGVRFSLFVFVDSYVKLKKIQKILNFVAFKKCLARSYHCLEIDYKLLGAINFFNLNKEEMVSPINQILCDKGGANKNKIIELSLSKNKSNRPFICKKANFNTEEFNFKTEFNLNKNQIENLLGFSGLFVVQNNECIKVENFTYSNYIERQNIEINSVEIEVKRTFDFELNAQIYKIKFQNFSNNFEALKICFGKVFCNLTPKNVVYIDETKGNKINLNLKTINQTLFLYGDKFERKITKKFMGAIKNIKLLPNEKTELYLMNFLDVDNFKNYESKMLLPTLFDEAIFKYKNIKLPKVFSQNKSINDLVNFYLPQKIFEKTIVSHSANNIDFAMLKNMVFDAKLVNKDLIDGRVSNFYLLNKNLFSIFQNLMYFYFGVFPSRLGANVNIDKSLVLNNATTSFELGEKKFVISFKNLGLKNEVQINNIKYSNLKFLTFNSCKKNQIEVLY